MEKEVKAVTWEGTDGFSELFNEQFTISDFCTTLEQAETQSTLVIKSARTAIRKAYDNQGPESRFVVDMTDEIKQAIDSGEVRLDTGKNGEAYAQLRFSNGHYGEKLSIKEELQAEGLSAGELKLAMQMEMIKDQLKAIIDGVKEIEGKVTEAIQGQRDDRIGLFYSGLSLYLEARSISDEYLKKQILSQAIKSISDANHQVIQDIRTAMEYLMAEKYKEAPSKMMKNVEERLSTIHQCYDVVFRASFLKAAIYQENGEIPAMIMTIDEYGRFVEKMIIPYVGKLSELDRDSHFIEKGTWGKMAHSLTGCNEIRQKLTSGSTYYLSLGGTVDDQG